MLKTRFHSFVKSNFLKSVFHDLFIRDNNLILQDSEYFKHAAVSLCQHSTSQASASVEWVLAARQTASRAPQCLWRHWGSWDSIPCLWSSTLRQLCECRHSETAEVLKIVTVLQNLIIIPKRCSWGSYGPGLEHVINIARICSECCFHQWEFQIEGGCQRIVFSILKII